MYIYKKCFTSVEAILSLEMWVEIATVNRLHFWKIWEKNVRVDQYEADNCGSTAK